MPVRPSKVLVVSPVILFDMQEANEKKKTIFCVISYSMVIALVSIYG